MRIPCAYLQNTKQFLHFHHRNLVIFYINLYSNCSIGRLFLVTIGKYLKITINEDVDIFVCQERRNR